MPNDVAFLQNERVMLGPVRQDLVETYQRWMNDLGVVRTLMNRNMPMTLQGEQSWLDQTLTSSSDAVFTIYRRDTGEAIGNCGLHNIDHLHGTADFGLVIGERSAWNQGFGTAATTLIVQYGFDALSLKNIMLEVFASNPAAMRVYEKAGFRLVGTRRSAFAVGRERTDVIYMDAVPEDFPPSELHMLLVDGPPQP
jgi:RimJ/RimL family protein N-acetyltransferase